MLAVRLWRQQSLTTTNMEKQSTLSLPQRKALVAMLEQKDWGECLWRRIKRKYEAKRGSLMARFVKQLATEKGADKLLLEVNQLKTKLRKAEEDLTLAGFRVDSHGILSLGDAAPDSWRETLDSEVDKELELSLDNLSEKFETATLKLWTVETAEQAHQIVEELQSIEVK